MVYLISGAIGWLVGSAVSEVSLSLYGLALGLMVAEIFNLRKKLNALETRSEEMPQTPDPQTAKAATSTPPSPTAAAPEPAEPGPTPIHPKTAAPTGAPAESADASSPRPAAYRWLQGAQDKAPPNKEDAGEDLFTRIGDCVKTYFTTGNVVTKIGVIVLFFGVAFLLKYAAQRNLVPIEFRLIVVFAGGLALLFTGWRLRTRRKIYGLLLQGGGVGVLYLTVYAAARFYHLLPYGFSFVVMFALVVLSAILAVLQDARYLAVCGIVGGFLAPVLMSTGSGSHVVLFSYYALLNLGIAGIAWFKAWRELNLIGFVSTFGIASLWGGRYYQPLYFSSTEPFLILFFLFYVTIAVLFALRQPLQLKGYVDGTLVFGTPLVAFGLQYGLVRDFPYGLAISALSLGLFYCGLASILWRRQKNDLRMLTESFLALGVVFASLAIPLALDGRWTSAAWALEGAAILWVGIRQDRLLPRLFGTLLQVGAAIAFLVAVYQPAAQMPILNSIWTGAALISLTSLFSSWYITRRSKTLYPWERQAAIPLMAWGLLWWFGAAWHEIYRFVAWRDSEAVLLIHAAASFLILDLVSRRLDWKPLSFPSSLLLPMMAIACIYHFSEIGDGHLFARFGSLAWCLATGAQYRLLFKCETNWPAKMVPLWHQGALWLLMLVITAESAYWVDVWVPEGPTWFYCILGLVPGSMMLVLQAQGERLRWPVGRFPDAYLRTGAAPLIAYLFIWAVVVNIYNGDPTPLPFLPLLNPIELSQIYLLLIVHIWVRRQAEWLHRPERNMDSGVLKMIIWGAGFLLINATVARTIHHWGFIAYSFAGLYRSVLFQAAISILWGVIALVVTFGSTKKDNRPAWIAGATILALVVIKLFFVDLAGTGTVARIVSFLGVGSLMLLMGYSSPLPPSRTRKAE